MLSEDMENRTRDPSSNWLANLADKGVLLVQFRNPASMTTENDWGKYTYLHSNKYGHKYIYKIQISKSKMEGSVISSLLLPVPEAAASPHTVPVSSLRFDAVVKVRVNIFVHIGHLVTRTAISSSNMDIAAINDPFMDLNYMVYMFTITLPLEC